MKNYLVGLLVAFITAIPVASLASDRVIINGGGIYADSDITFPEGSDPSGVLIGGAPIYGGDGWGVLDIYLTEKGTGIISDHLYSLPGASHACDAQGNGADCLFFSSDPANDISIGTVCTRGSNYCLEETGLLQDVTFLVAAQNGGSGIYGGGSIMIQSDVDAVPEPGTFVLLGLGIAALGLSKRKVVVQGIAKK